MLFAKYRFAYDIDHTLFNCVLVRSACLSVIDCKWKYLKWRQLFEININRVAAFYFTWRNLSLYIFKMLFCKHT